MNEIIEMGIYPASIITDEERVHTLEDENLRCNRMFCSLHSIVTEERKVSRTFGDVRSHMINDYECGGQYLRRVETEDGRTGWYLYEPLLWEVIEEDNDSMLLLCCSVIDNIPMNPQTMTQKIRSDGEYTYVVDSGTYANVFYGSYLDMWLNCVLLQDAFTKEEQSRIIPYEVPVRLLAQGFGNAYSSRLGYGQKILIAGGRQIKLLKGPDIKPSDHAMHLGAKEEYWLTDKLDDYNTGDDAYVGDCVYTARPGGRTGIRRAHEHCGVVPLIRIRKD